MLLRRLARDVGVDLAFEFVDQRDAAWIAGQAARNDIVLLDSVMPAAFVLDWLWFTPKGRLRWIDPVKWLAFPLVYGGWTLIHGLATHWWPYGFVDVDALGLGRVVAIFGALLVFFLLVGLALVGLDRVFGRTARDSSAPAL